MTHHQKVVLVLFVLSVLSVLIAWVVALRKTRQNTSGNTKE